LFRSDYCLGANRISARRGVRRPLFAAPGAIPKGNVSLGIAKG
jgi:hypothetical protein